MSTIFNNPSRGTRLEGVAAFTQTWFPAGNVVPANIIDSGANVFELIIGVVVLVLSLNPRAKFREGTITGEQTGPVIEPSWIPRLLMIFAALIAIVDGIQRIRHH